VASVPNDPLFPGGRTGEARIPIRRVFARIVTALFAVTLLSSCGNADKWHGLDVSKTSAPLSFEMTRAEDGKQVTAADYRGHVVMLYFGYTYCPDICPTTLANIASVLQAMGSQARDVSVLFVTVDPNRDTLPVLASYMNSFAPEIQGLRGTPDQLARLARRYRVAYSVTPGTKDQPYEVSHSSALYVFDTTGKARLLVPSLDTPTPDIAGTQADLERLIENRSKPGFVAWLRQYV
jgi:protein SCO1